MSTTLVDIGKDDLQSHTISYINKQKTKSARSIRRLHATLFFRSEIKQVQTLSTFKSHCGANVFSF